VRVGLHHRKLRARQPLVHVHLGAGLGGGGAAAAKQPAERREEAAAAALGARLGARRRDESVGRRKRGRRVAEEELLEPDERARQGLFLAFQYPVAIPGVTVANFLRTAINARRRAANPEDKGMPIPEFRKMLIERMSLLKMDSAFAGRYLNDGFSGGEKKRAEILQMATLKPEIAILDETDSGLDIDALRIVSEGVNALTGPELGVLVITHYQRLLNYIKPQFVHIMLGGRIVESGGADLALHLEEHGYDWVREKYENGVTI